ncbi:MAG: MATE family efflux transporter [Bacteroidota bacterium]
MPLTNTALGTRNIKKLLFQQALPASVGILFMTVNIVVDTIFIGRWIGSTAIAALTVITPIAFIISSLGLAIGSGGSSVLSRALGSKKEETAVFTFSHQIMLTFILSMSLVIIGWFFCDEILALFGAQGKILAPAKEFYYPILLSAPLQAFCAMGNSVIRAENKSSFAMTATIVASIGNIILDIVFIKLLNWGIFGAALATAVSYSICFGFVVWFFIFKSKIRLLWKHFKIQSKTVIEIISLSAAPFFRQGVIGVLAVVLNHVLFQNGGENAVTVYGIISKMLMFALFPISGITEAFLPIAGYNYGAKKFNRVKEAVRVAISSGVLISATIYVLVFIFAEQLTSIFTEDQKVLRDTPNAIRWIFATSAIIVVQLIGSAYFQAIGKAKPSLLLTLSKQGIFLIPLLLILPNFFGIFGVWLSFPIADILATLVTVYFLRKDLNHLNPK